MKRQLNRVLYSALFVAAALVVVGGSQASAQIRLGRVNIGLPSIRPHESESTVWPGTMGLQNGRPAASNQMRNLGYRRYNNVQVDANRNVYINGVKQRNAADRFYNPNTKQHFYSYRTDNGGRIVRQSNGNVWVKPAQPKPQYQMNNNSSQGGRYLGTVPQFWNR